MVLAAAAAAGTTAAHAEETPTVISPLRVETDRNDVNLVNGRTQINLPVLAVPAAPNLRFDRIQNAAPYALGRAQGGGLDNFVVNWSVHTGTGASESFRCDSGTCESVTGTGSTFGGNSYVQAGSGARWNFRNKHIDTTRSDPNGTAQYYLTSIVYPNGEIVSYIYGTATQAGDTRTWYRPTRISSNLGYHISIAYQPGTFPDADWSTVSTATLYRTADNLALRRFTYSGNTITDNGDTIDDAGDDRVYICSGCNNALGLEVETTAGSMRLPGEASNTLQVVASTQAGVLPGHPIIGAATRDGVAWNYSYGNLRYDLPSNGYWYDAITVTGPESYSQTYSFHQVERRNVLDSVRDSIGRVTAFQYDAAYRPVRITSPEGNQVSVAYDGYGNIISRTSTPKPGSGLGAISETAFYRGDCAATETSALLCYRPLWHRDALGRQTDFAYNAAGQLTERTDPADASGVRRRTIVEYETTATGISRRNVERVCGTGAACGTTSEIRTEYDYLGDTLLVTAERRIDAARNVILTTTYTHDAAGRVLSVNGPIPGADDTVHSRYDAFGRKVREVGPRGDNPLRLTQVHHYRAADDKVTRIDTATVLNPDDVPAMLSWTEFAYDARRNPVREMVRATNASGATITYNVLQRTFDLRNRLQCEARRMNPAQFAVSLLPASACLRDTEGIAPNDFGYDRITQHIYDAADQLLQERRGVDTPLLQNYAAFTYTPNGQRSSVTDANGNRAELRYDGFDRLARWVFPSRTTDGAVNEGDYESYGYDAAGNRTSLRKRDGSTLTYEYDNLNRMTRKIVPERTGLATTHTRDVFYGYNVLDLPTFTRFDSSSGQGVTDSYDAFGRLLTSTINMDGVSRAVARVRDDAANRIQLTYAGQTYRYDFDPAGRLRALFEGTGTTTVLADFDYNARGQVELRAEGALIDSGQATSSVDPRYDEIGRLTSLAHAFAGSSGNVTLGFTRYNPANQIDTRTRNNDGYAWNGGLDLSRNYTANGLNQYTAAGGTTFAYDANGNLTRSGSTTYVYDVENRLVSASGGQTANLRYDPLGRLYEVGGATPSRRFLWDGDALVAEYTPAGSLAARYVHGTAAGADDPLVWYSSGENRRLHTDHQGSVIAVTGGDGAIRWINGYDEWGIPNTPSNTGRFQYTGQTWIAELGMYHYKARIYSPTLGRFLQVDPIGYDDQMNLYAYVANDPLNRVDPTGEDGTCLYTRSGCDWGTDYTPVVNFFRGMISYPRDLAVEIRHVVRLSGLAGVEGRNRALLVDRIAQRGIRWAINNPGVILRFARNWIVNNKAFSAGRALVGAGVGMRAGGAAGVAGLVTSVTGGAVNQLNRIAGQLEGAGISADSLSDRTLATIVAAGILGARANFDARTGNITVSMRNTETGTRLSRTRTVVVCNVEEGC